MILGRRLFAMVTALTMAPAVGPATAQQAAQQPAPAGPSGEWATKPIPLEVFSRFPQIDQPNLSPDGKWLALKVRSNGGQALAIVPLDGSARPQLVSRDGAESADRQGDRQVASWRWLDNDHLLISIVYRDNFLGDWIDIQRFAVVNRTNSRVTPLAWDDSIGSQSLLWASREGSPRVLIQRLNNRELASTTRAEVIDVDARTGKFTVAQPQNVVVRNWTADAAGVVRFGSTYSGDTGQLLLMYRQRAGENMRTIARQRTGTFDDDLQPNIVLRGDKAFIYSRKDGYRALYEYDLATMAIGRRVFGFDGYDIGGAAIAPTGDRLDGVSVTTQRTRVHYFDARLKEIQAAIEGTAGVGNALIVSADRAREKIVFIQSRVGQAPGYYLFDTTTGNVRLIGWLNDSLKGAQLNPVRTVKYKASDGKEIEAVLTTPRLRAGQKNLPLVILPHGGPWARDDADWDPYGWAQAIAEMGYVVIQPNFRGSSGYGRAWEKDAEGKWGYRMSDDLNEAIPFLAGQGLVDAKRVCMMGWSYGGYAAARAAQRDGRLYRCTIAGAAPVDMPAMVAYDKDYLGRYRSRQALGAASSNLVDISPALNAGQVSTPILIVHGAKDQRVPVAQARGFVARLKKAGKVEGRDFVYLEQPQNTHNLLREADRVQLLTAVRDFLTKHNPA